MARIEAGRDSRLFNAIGNWESIQARDTNDAHTMIYSDSYVNYAAIENNEFEVKLTPMETMIHYESHSTHLNRLAFIMLYC